MSGSQKSNFAQTCNLLSQYLKERGNIRALNLDILAKLDAKGKPETSRMAGTATMELLPNKEKLTTIDLSSTKEYSKQTPTTQHLMVMPKAIDLLPQYTVGSLAEDPTNKASSSKSTAMESKAAQMTIFYGGHVLVFDDIPADKAMEVFQLASNGISSPNGLASASNTEKMEPGDSLLSTSNALPNLNLAPEKESDHSRTEASNSDLPIARRASLHRFLAKRKDRVIARAPYQIHNASSDGYPKQDEQLELKL